MARMHVWTVWIESSGESCTCKILEVKTQRKIARTGNKTFKKHFFVSQFSSVTHPWDAYTDPIFKNVGILKFHDIYVIQLDLFMYSYQNHTLPSRFHCKFTLQNQIHSYNTRNSYEFRLPFCRTRIKQFSVFYQGPKFYNTLNTDIVNSSSHVRH